MFLYCLPLLLGTWCLYTIHILTLRTVSRAEHSNKQHYLLKNGLHILPREQTQFLSSPSLLSLNKCTEVTPIAQILSQLYSRALVSTTVWFFSLFQNPGSFMENTCMLTLGSCFLLINSIFVFSLFFYRAF